MNRLRVYFEFARPFTLLAPHMGFWAGGLAALGAHDLTLATERVLPILLGALMAAALNVASNGINQIYDLPIDAVNKPTRPLPSKRMSLREAWLVTLVFYALALALAWLASPPEGGRECFVIVAIAAFLTYAYSAPPFRTKKYWQWANLTITLPRGLLLPVAGWASAATVREAEPWFIGSIFGLFILGAATTKDFSDMKGDAEGGCATIPVRFGVKTAAWITVPFLVIPFLMFPLGAWFGVLRGNATALCVLGFALALYGLYVAFLILRRPESLATESNHASWKHMYLQMTVAQVGYAVCYWV